MGLVRRIVEQTVTCDKCEKATTETIKITEKDPLGSGTRWAQGFECKWENGKFVTLCKKCATA